MKSKSLIARFLALGLGASFIMCLGPVQAKSYKPLYKMNSNEVTQYLKSLKGQPFLKRVEAISAQAKSTPYVLGPLGEGPKAPYDKDPLVDLTKVDCVTFCEQTLALALSQTYPEAVNTLQKIRYKKGEVKMECRNHFTMADWTTNNTWLMKDITPKIPGAQTLTRTISHKWLFDLSKYKDIEVREPDRKLTISYIPENKLLKSLPYLRSGDVGVLIQDHPKLFASHTGFMIKNPRGQWVFRNATSIGPKQVVDTPWSDLVSHLKKSKRLVGMAFIRPNGNLK